MSKGTEDPSRFMMLIIAILGLCLCRLLLYAASMD
ncbi:hypothetical protein BSP101_0175 [Salmonella phage BSP101]|uniref:Uncharacterized protein n=1 Tax=Salmonella phage BSP101 TaxID=1958914 RepID=A0A2P0QED3_9CAUD|nr:hypothetical protein HYP09_gp113 [Salmonella phage BSP101]ARM70012.1 hypothetical protein BSP101_0175 [Salmonella phage BSP101]